MDFYLVEVVCDSKLLLVKFFLFVEVVLILMRMLDDGFYRVIDIYFKVGSNVFDFCLFVVFVVCWFFMFVFVLVLIFWLYKFINFLYVNMILDIFECGGVWEKEIMLDVGLLVFIYFGLYVCCLEWMFFFLYCCLGFVWWIV